MQSTKALVLALGIMAWGLPALGGSAEFSAEDVEAVKTANKAYVDAWLANDPDAVMSTLTDDAVLLPHHGDDPVVGTKAIRQFWFPPDSPPSKVTHMVTSVAEVQGCGDLAVVWGRLELEFEYAGKTYRNEGNYLSVFKKGEDGRWLVARRIWNDPVAEVD